VSDIRYPTAGKPILEVELGRGSRARLKGFNAAPLWVCPVPKPVLFWFPIVSSVGLADNCPESNLASVETCPILKYQVGQRQWRLPVLRVLLLGQFSFTQGRSGWCWRMIMHAILTVGSPEGHGLGVAWLRPWLHKNGPVFKSGL